MNPEIFSSISVTHVWKADNKEEWAAVKERMSQGDHKDTTGRLLGATSYTKGKDRLEFTLKEGRREKIAMVAAEAIKTNANGEIDKKDAELGYFERGRVCILKVYDEKTEKHTYEKVNINSLVQRLGLKGQDKEILISTLQRQNENRKQIQDKEKKIADNYRKLNKVIDDHFPSHDKTKITQEIKAGNYEGVLRNYRDIKKLSLEFEQILTEAHELESELKDLTQVRARTVTTVDALLAKHLSKTASNGPAANLGGRVTVAAQPTHAAAAPTHAAAQPTRADQTPAVDEDLDPLLGQEVKGVKVKQATQKKARQPHVDDGGKPLSSQSQPTTSASSASATTSPYSTSASVQDDGRPASIPQAAAEAPQTDEATLSREVKSELDAGSAQLVQELVPEILQKGVEAAPPEARTAPPISESRIRERRPFSAEDISRAAQIREKREGRKEAIEQLDRSASPKLPKRVKSSESPLAKELSAAAQKMDSTIKTRQAKEARAKEEARVKQDAASSATTSSSASVQDGGPVSIQQAMEGREISGNISQAIASRLQEETDGLIQKMRTALSDADYNEFVRVVQSTTARMSEETSIPHQIDKIQSILKEIDKAMKGAGYTDDWKTSSNYKGLNDVRNSYEEGMANLKTLLRLALRQRIPEGIPEAVKAREDRRPEQRAKLASTTQAKLAPITQEVRQTASSVRQKAPAGEKAIEKLEEKARRKIYRKREKAAKRKAARVEKNLKESMATSEHFPKERKDLLSFSPATQEAYKAIYKLAERASVLVNLQPANLSKNKQKQLKKINDVTDMLNRFSSADVRQSMERGLRIIEDLLTDKHIVEVEDNPEEIAELLQSARARYEDLEQAAFKKAEGKEVRKEELAKKATSLSQSRGRARQQKIKEKELAQEERLIKSWQSAEKPKAVQKSVTAESFMTVKVLTKRGHERTSAIEEMSRQVENLFVESGLKSRFKKELKALRKTGKLTDKAEALRKILRKASSFEKTKEGNPQASTVPQEVKDRVQKYLSTIEQAIREPLPSKTLMRNMTALLSYTTPFLSTDKQTDEQKAKQTDEQKAVYKKLMAQGAQLARSENKFVDQEQLEQAEALLQAVNSALKEVNVGQDWLKDFKGAADASKTSQLLDLRSALAKVNANLSFVKGEASTFASTNFAIADRVQDLQEHVHELAKDGKLDSKVRVAADTFDKHATAFREATTKEEAGEHLATMLEVASEVVVHPLNEESSDISAAIKAFKGLETVLGKDPAVIAHVKALQDPIGKIIDEWVTDDEIQQAGDEFKASIAAFRTATTQEEAEEHIQDALESSALVINGLIAKGLEDEDTQAAGQAFEILKKDIRKEEAPLSSSTLSRAKVVGAVAVLGLTAAAGAYAAYASNLSQAVLPEVLSEAAMEGTTAFTATALNAYNQAVSLPEDVAKVFKTITPLIPLIGTAEIQDLAREAPRAVASFAKGLGEGIGYVLNRLSAHVVTPIHARSGEEFSIPTSTRRMPTRTQRTRVREDHVDNEGFPTPLTYIEARGRSLTARSLNAQLKQLQIQKHKAQSNLDFYQKSDSSDGATEREIRVATEALDSIEYSLADIQNRINNFNERARAAGQPQPGAVAVYSGLSDVIDLSEGLKEAAFSMPIEVEVPRSGLQEEAQPTTTLAESIQDAFTYFPPSKLAGYVVEALRGNTPRLEKEGQKAVEIVVLGIKNVIEGVCRENDLREENVEEVCLANLAQIATQGASVETTQDFLNNTFALPQTDEFVEALVNETVKETKITTQERIDLQLEKIRKKQQEIDDLEKQRPNLPKAFSELQKKYPPHNKNLELAKREVRNLHDNIAGQIRDKKTEQGVLEQELQGLEKQKAHEVRTQERERAAELRSKAVANYVPLELQEASLIDLSKGLQKAAFSIPVVVDMGTVPTPIEEVIESQKAREAFNAEFARLAEQGQKGQSHTATSTRSSGQPSSAAETAAQKFYQTMQEVGKEYHVPRELMKRLEVSVGKKLANPPPPVLGAGPRDPKLSLAEIVTPLPSPTNRLHGDLQNHLGDEIPVNKFIQEMCLRADQPAPVTTSLSGLMEATKLPLPLLVKHLGPALKGNEIPLEEEQQQEIKQIAGAIKEVINATCEERNWGEEAKHALTSMCSANLAAMSEREDIPETTEDLLADVFTFPEDAFTKTTQKPGASPTVTYLRKDLDVETYRREDLDVELEQAEEAWVHDVETRQGQGASVAQPQSGAVDLKPLELPAESLSKELQNAAANFSLKINHTETSLPDLVEEAVKESGIKGLAKDVATILKDGPSPDLPLSSKASHIARALEHVIRDTCEAHDLNFMKDMIIGNFTRIANGETEVQEDDPLAFLDAVKVHPGVFKIPEKVSEVVREGWAQPAAQAVPNMLRQFGGILAEDTIGVLQRVVEDVPTMRKALSDVAQHLRNMRSTGVPEEAFSKTLGTCSLKEMINAALSSLTQVFPRLTMDDVLRVADKTSEVIEPLYLMVEHGVPTVAEAIKHARENPVVIQATLSVVATLLATTIAMGRGSGEAEEAAPLRTGSTLGRVRAPRGRPPRGRTPQGGVVRQAASSPTATPPPSPKKSVPKSLSFIEDQLKEVGSKTEAADAKALLYARVATSSDEAFSKLLLDFDADVEIQNELVAIRKMPQAERDAYLSLLDARTKVLHRQEANLEQQQSLAIRGQEGKRKDLQKAMLGLQQELFDIENIFVQQAEYDQLNKDLEAELASAAEKRKQIGELNREKNKKDAPKAIKSKNARQVPLLHAQAQKHEAKGEDIRKELAQLHDQLHPLRELVAKKAREAAEASQAGPGASSSMDREVKDAETIPDDGGSADREVKGAVDENAQRKQDIEVRLGELNKQLEQDVLGGRDELLQKIAKDERDGLMTELAALEAEALSSEKVVKEAGVGETPRTKASSARTKPKQTLTQSRIPTVKERRAAQDAERLEKAQAQVIEKEQARFQQRLQENTASWLSAIQSRVSMYEELDKKFASQKERLEEGMSKLSQEIELLRKERKAIPTERQIKERLEDPQVTGSRRKNLKQDLKEIGGLRKLQAEKQHALDKMKKYFQPTMESWQRDHQSFEQSLEKERQNLEKARALTAPPSMDREMKGGQSRFEQKAQLARLGAERLQERANLDRLELENKLLLREVRVLNTLIHSPSEKDPHRAKLEGEFEAAQKDLASNQSQLEKLRNDKRIQSRIEQAETAFHASIVADAEQRLGEIEDILQGPIPTLINKEVLELEQDGLKKSLEQLKGDGGS